MAISHLPLIPTFERLILPNPLANLPTWSKLLFSALLVSQEVTLDRDTSSLFFGHPGGIGQPLSLLLKINTHITEVSFGSC